MSILRMNKTDFERLCASFDILPALFSHPYSRLSSDRTLRGPSFAEIPQTDAVLLARLPGSGPKKVARLNHVFDQPFHHMGMGRTA